MFKIFDVMNVLFMYFSFSIVEFLSLRSPEQKRECSTYKLQFHLQIAIEQYYHIVLWRWYCFPVRFIVSVWMIFLAIAKCVCKSPFSRIENSNWILIVVEQMQTKLDEKKKLVREKQYWIANGDDWSRTAIWLKCQAQDDIYI